MSLRRGAIEQAKVAINDARARLLALGAIAEIDGQLKAGEHVLTGSTEIVEAIKERHGFGCTIFHGNVRISTTAVAAGSEARAIGTTANLKVTQQVLRHGNAYEGIAHTLGKAWVIAYVPLRDRTERIVGMLAAFRELDSCFDDLSLLNDVREAVLLHTLDGVVTDANQSACDMLGRQHAQLVGALLSTFSEALEDGSAVEDSPDGRFAPPPEVEQRWRTPDDYAFIVKAHRSVVRGVDGDRGLLIARDFSDDYAARERLRGINGQLQQLLAETEQHAHRLAELNTMSRQLSLAETEEDVHAIGHAFTPRIISVDRVDLTLLDGKEQPRDTIADRDGRGGPGMCAPLRIGDKVIGTLNVARDEHGAYSPKDISLIEQVALVWASNLESKRLTRQTQSALRESDQLLLNIMPAAIARRLKAGEQILADDYSETTILFADIVGFTELASRVTPIELVTTLNRIFSTFDQLAERHGLEKVKTIGDAYMVVAGLPVPSTVHAMAMAEMALGMREAMHELRAELGNWLDIRIGMHSGSVIAGVIGKKKIAYDVWGDAVNTASRMESHGVPGRIHASEACHVLLRQRYRFEARGVIEVKGKGSMTTFFLEGRA